MSKQEKPLNLNENVSGNNLGGLESIKSEIETRNEYVKEGLPTAQLQLEIIVKLGVVAYDKAKGKKRKIAWEAYKKCIDDFRKGYGLPPLDEAWTKYKVPIGEAMERGDAKDLLKIFDTEKTEYPKAREFWEKLSNTEGVNFVTGVVGGVKMW